jgi:hypothetical protein
MPRRTSHDDRAELQHLEGDERLRAAARIMHESHDLDMVRTAIGVIGEAESPEWRGDLIAKYEWCETQPVRRDGGGYIRAALVRALRPVSDTSDAALFQCAMNTYEIDNTLEFCGDLRAVGLLAMNGIDPSLATNWAARLMLDPQVTFSGDPARIAIRLLASHGILAPIFGMVSWEQGRNDVLAEGLRNLTGLHVDLLPMLVERYIGNEDEQVILGLFDLLLGHITRDMWCDEIERWFRTTTVMDLYGVVAIQVVTSRSEALITMLHNLREEEIDLLRRGMLDQALALA